MQLAFRTRALAAASVLVAAACGAPADDKQTEEEENVAGTVQPISVRFQVDDDRRQCPNAAFTTIQPAVDAAASGDTIEVCAGVYDDPVIIGKTLRLLGAQHGRDGRTRGGSLASESLLLQGTEPFRVDADNVVIDGFSLRVVLTDGEGVGIRLSNAFSGYRVVNNIMDADGTSAIFAGSSGVIASLIRHNLFTSRFGVAGDSNEGPISRNYLIEENRFVDSSLVMLGAEHENVRIRKNKLIRGSIELIDTGFPASGPAMTLMSVVDNEVEAAIDPAIALRRVEDSRIANNRLRDGQQQGITVSGSNEGLEIEDNHIAGFAGTGISLGLSPANEQTAGVQLEGNEVEDCGQGILLLSALVNRVLDNNVEDNRGAGIVADAASLLNLIQGNEVRGNGDLDCSDASSNGGTSGTANTWLNNEGSTSSPAGLCVDDP